MIEIKGVSKSFGAVKVLENIDLRMEPGEFFCLLGPSGCGKTTLLRLVAGLETPDTGSIHVGGKDVTSSPPHLRGCAMVFQSYALWPHLTVAENITYGLEVQKKSRQEINKVLEESLKTYQLEGLGQRHPHQLSGGQQQRVALARAMAMRPQAVLMDEPLSNLDAALRKTLRRELLDFHRSSGNTILYVTHDQEEALALSDRIAVLMQGKVVECGEARRLYERPGHLETALFLGDMNAFRDGRREGDRIRFGSWDLPAPDKEDSAGLAAGGEAHTLCIRPENVRVGKGGPESNREGRSEALPGKLRFIEFLGTHATLGVDTAAGSVLARVTSEEAALLKTGDGLTLELPVEYRLWYRGKPA